MLFEFSRVLRSDLAQAEGSCNDLTLHGCHLDGICLGRIITLLKQGQETIKQFSIKLQVGVAEEGGWDCVKGMDDAPGTVTGLFVDESSVRDAMVAGHKRFQDLNPGRGKGARTSKSSRGGKSGRGGRSADPSPSNSLATPKKRPASPLNVSGGRALRMCWGWSGMGHQLSNCPKRLNVPATTVAGAGARATRGGASGSKTAQPSKPAAKTVKKGSKPTHGKKN